MTDPTHADARIRHPLTDTWVAREVISQWIDEHDRESWLDTELTELRNHIAAALTAARREERDEARRSGQPNTDEEERAREILEATDFHGERMEYSLRLGVVAEALAEARRDERERCAQHIEARAIAIRDHGPVSKEGLLVSLAGAQVGALLDAAASLRNGAAEAGFLPPFGRPASLSAAGANDSAGPGDAP